jgi:fatty acid desaturase
VPFHALAKLNALVGKRTQVTAPGYFALHRRLLRQLRTVTAVAKSEAKS